MKRVISLILAAMMILTALSLFSCGKEEKTTAGADETSEIEVVSTKPKDDPNSKYDAEIKNLNGHEFKFITLTAAATHLVANEVYAEELNGETINDAVFKRNSKLEKDYNCKIIEEKNENPVGTAKTALTAGEYVYDYIYTAVKSEFSLTSSDLLADLNSLDNINMEKIWWDQNFNKALGINGKLFYGVGDAGTMDDRSTWVLVFNKSRLDTLGLEIPYDMVKEGKWTTDKMYEYMEKTVEDRDGDGAIVWNKDFLGYTGERFNGWVHAAACGGTVTQFTDGGDIFLGETLSDKFMTAWDAIKPIFTSPYYCCTDSSAAFKNGRCEFYGINSATVSSISANTTVEFGIIPFPKLNEAQEQYYSTASASWFGGYSIPKTCDQAEDAVANGFKDGIEQAAYFLEAYAYESMNTLTVAFYDQVLMRQTAQDPDSRRMIEMALENKVYDPAMFFGWGSIDSVIKTSVNVIEKGAYGDATNWNNVTAGYQQKLPTAQKALDAYINYLDNVA